MTREEIETLYIKAEKDLKEEKERRDNFRIYGQTKKPRPEWKWWLNQIRTNFRRNPKSV